MVLVVEAIFEIFRQKSDFKPILRVPIVLKPSKMDSTSKIGVGASFSGFLSVCWGSRERSNQVVVVIETIFEIFLQKVIFS